MVEPCHYPTPTPTPNPNANPNANPNPHSNLEPYQLDFVLVVGGWDSSNTARLPQIQPSNPNTSPARKPHP